MLLNKPSKEIVQKVRIKIESERKTLPQFSMFGDNNWETSESIINLIDRYLNGKFDFNTYKDEENSTIYECACWLNGEDSDFASDYLDQ
jgi:hypothetical protein